jgi:predicted AAA+ superfamily ATPase
MDKLLPALAPYLARIADALERISPPERPVAEINDHDAFLWHAETRMLQPVPDVNRVDVELLKGVDQQRDTLLANTKQFANGLPANNALLWGARGMGKSSLVKSIHRAINKEKPHALALIEINRDDIPTLPALLRILRYSNRHFILFCDDLSFSADENIYKSLKAVLEGGLEGRPANVIFYATSNRRHLMPRDMIDNERSTAINPSEAVEEKVSLSDRFGLWLGFHSCDQETYLSMIDAYADWLKIPLHQRDTLHAEALEWSITRGARSGRVAWQFMQNLAGRLAITLPKAA